jgi:hypothetical protein
MGAAAAAAALALAAAGCGGSSDDSSSESAATTTAVVSGGGNECEEMAALEERFSIALLRATSGKSVRVTAASKVFASMADEVPEELRDDFEALADAFAAYGEALEGIDIKAGTVPNAAQVAKLEAAAKAFDQQAVDKASTTIEGWIQDNCA